MPPASRFFALLLVGLLVGLPAAAFADPPDPTWIGGYWDDDDFDNAVIALSSSSAIHVPAQIDAGAVGREAVARLDSLQEESCRAPVRSAVLPRAPPVDSPTHS